jgi:Leucine-rich repeat (LRR) protein
MVNLRVLYIGNSFTMYPPMAITGPNMNKIKQFPDKIGQLQNLKVLNLTAVDLRSLSKGIIELNQLDTLDVSFNAQLNISNELVTLDKMLWLKYLNIVGTNADRSAIEHLRKSLPNTKISSDFEELLIPHAVKFWA